MALTAGVPISSETNSASDRLRGSPNSTAKQRRQQRERQAGRQPMRGDLGGGDALQRQRRQRDHIERAVLEIGLEQTVEREQRRQHRRDPQHAARDAREQGQIRADAERHQRRHRRRRTPAPASRCRPRAWRAGCRAAAARSCEHQPVAIDAERLVRRDDRDAAARAMRRDEIGRDLLARRHRARPAARPAATAAAPQSFSRASATRFFWPAERYCPGRSASRASPTASSARRCRRRCHRAARRNAASRARSSAA